MKNKIAFCFLFISTILVLSIQSKMANAQNSDKFDLYVEAGTAIPAAPYEFTQNWNVGYGIGAGVSYRLNPSLKLKLLGKYYHFGFTKSGARRGVNFPQEISSIDGADSELYSTMLNVIYDYELPSTPVTPYFSAGVGFLYADRDDITISTTDNKYNIDQSGGSAMGINAAVGLERALSNNLSFYLEAKFTTALFVNNWTQYVPINVGISF